MRDDIDLQQRVQLLADSLLKTEHRVACAESCTGGWLAKVLTDLPGSSQWFECGLVTYSNRSKQKLLGVPEAVLQQYGAVSGETVVAMVKGLLSRCDAQYGVSISGIAGPEGGSVSRPVGTVWIAWSQAACEPLSRCFRFSGDREEVRREAVEVAIVGLIDMVKNA